MATITITIPREHEAALYQGFAASMDYQEYIGEGLKRIVNPQSKQDFLVDWIKNNLISIASSYMFQSQEEQFHHLMKQARQEIEAQVDTLVNVTIKE